jgi:hypothetical protein
VYGCGVLVMLAATRLADANLRRVLDLPTVV